MAGDREVPADGARIYLAERADEGLSLRAYSHDARAFEPSPARSGGTLEPVRQQLVSARKRQGLESADILRVETPKDSPGRLLTIALATMNVEVRP